MTFESFSPSQQKFLNFVIDNLGSQKKVLLNSGTGSGKTTLISSLPTFVVDKTIFISLSPTVAITERIRDNQVKLDVPSFTFENFRKSKPSHKIISIVDTHSSINSESSKIHHDGDTKGVIKILFDYYNQGYNIVLCIDEAGIWVNDSSNEISKMVSKFPPVLQLHFTATPDQTISYDNIFSVPDEEILETGRVKSKVQINSQGYDDDYEFILDVLKKREDIEPFYFGHTVSAQFFLETGSQFKHDKNLIIEIARSKGIREDEIIDLSIEGRSDNSEKIENFVKEVGRNTKHKFKIIITKYAGAIGLDCPSISILALMRNLGKNSVSQKVQIIGRGKRTYNGLKPENEIQDTCFLYYKQDFILPEYLTQQVSNGNKVTYELKNDNLIKECNIVIPVLEEVEIPTNFKLIDEVINQNIYKTIQSRTYTISKKMYVKSSEDFSGKTLSILSSDDEINQFEVMNLSLAIKHKNTIKNKMESVLAGSFEYLLTSLNLSEQELVIDLQKNPIVREKLNELVKVLNTKVKKHKIVDMKPFEFPVSFERHVTNIEKKIDKDDISYDRVVFSDGDGQIFFDSEPELKFFEEIVTRKPLDFIFQNPRTNQGGVSFYIPEFDVNHAPDFVISFKNKIWFVEITSWNRIVEKEKFMNSEGVPNNYILVALNSKNKLLSLKKENYNKENYTNENSWTKINELYVNL
jgi:superfamily II DNA or RNA helicase